MKKTHIGSGVVLTAIGLICLLWVIPATTSPPDSPLDLPPAFIPMLSVWIFMVLSIVLLVTAFRKQGDDKELHEEFGADATGVGLKEFGQISLWTVTAGISWLIMTYVGFEPAMTLLIGAILIFVGLRNYWILAATAILVPIVLSQFVWYVFETQMPGFWRF